MHTLRLALAAAREVEQPVHKTHFSRRAGFQHEALQALPFADNPHHFEAFDRRRGGRPCFEPARRIVQPLQSSVISLQLVVEIFDLSVLDALSQIARLFEAPTCRKD